MCVSAFVSAARVEKSSVSHRLSAITVISTRLPAHRSSLTRQRSNGEGSGRAEKEGARACGGRK
jgi:hypothetical protein